MRVTRIITIILLLLIIASLVGVVFVVSGGEYDSVRAALTHCLERLSSFLPMLALFGVFIILVFTGPLSGRFTAYHLPARKHFFSLFGILVRTLRHAVSLGIVAARHPTLYRC